MDTGITLDPEEGGGYPRELYSFDHPVAVQPAPERFSDDDVDCYRRHGFLGVSDLLAPTEVAAVLDGLAAVLAAPRGADVQYEAWAADRVHDLSGVRRRTWCAA
ncbi:hypothetical protein ACFWRV_01600 [Streptomyces sp. NPDC058576]|uniref:hypothetical protein n=1 Tax=Streptomyces sp. NPDC058576 TaxID=3346547 RepID=UPI003646A6BA